MLKIAVIYIYIFIVKYIYIYVIVYCSNPSEKVNGNFTSVHVYRKYETFICQFAVQ